MNKNLLNIQEASKLLGVSKRTLRRWEEKGILVPERTSGSHRRYSREELDKFWSNYSKVKFGEDEKIAPNSSSKKFNITKSVVEADKEQKKYNSEIASSYDSNLRKIILTGSIAGLITLILLGIILSASGFHIGSKNGKLASVKSSAEDVLGLSVGDSRHIFRINVPSSFSQNVEFLNGIDVTGVATTSGGIITNNSDVDAGDGSVFASNLIYGIIAGEGITVSAGQTPTITSTGVLSIGGETGDISLVAGEGIGISGNTISNTSVYAAGSGISISDGTISSTVSTSQEDTFKNILIGSDTITASGTNDELEFIAGTNITLSANTTNKSITINSLSGGVGGSGTRNYIPRFSDTSTLEDSSIVDENISGTVLTISSGGRLGVGTTIPSALLDVAGTASFSGALNLYGTPQIQATSGQTLTLGGNTTGNIVLSPGNGSGSLQFTNLTTNGGIIYTNASGVVTQTGTGGNGQCLLSDGLGTPYFGACSSTPSGWDIANGVITPIYSSTLDLLLGGTSSESAKFAVLNIGEARGNQVASLSGDLVLDKTGSLSTTNNQTLTVGGGDTGNLILGNGSGICINSWKHFNYWRFFYNRSYNCKQRPNCCRWSDIYGKWNCESWRWWRCSRY